MLPLLPGSASLTGQNHKLSSVLVTEAVLSLSGQDVGDNLSNILVLLVRALISGQWTADLHLEQLVRTCGLCRQVVEACLLPAPVWSRVGDFPRRSRD